MRTAHLRDIIFTTRRRRLRAVFDAACFTDAYFDFSAPPRCLMSMPGLLICLRRMPWRRHTVRCLSRDICAFVSFRAGAMPDALWQIYVFSLFTRVSSRCLSRARLFHADAPPHATFAIRLPKPLLLMMLTRCLPDAHIDLTPVTVRFPILPCPFHPTPSFV